MRQYGSFVVRWWRAGLEVQRLHIRHVQSDQEVAAESLLENVQALYDELLAA